MTDPVMDEPVLKHSKKINADMRRLFELKPMHLRSSIIDYVCGLNMVKESNKSLAAQRIRGLVDFNVFECIEHSDSKRRETIIYETLTQILDRMPADRGQHPGYVTDTIRLLLKKGFIYKFEDQNRQDSLLNAINGKVHPEAGVIFHYNDNHKIATALAPEGTVETYNSVCARWMLAAAEKVEIRGIGVGIGGLRLKSSGELRDVYNKSPNHTNYLLRWAALWGAVRHHLTYDAVNAKPRTEIPETTLSAMDKVVQQRFVEGIERPAEWPSNEEDIERYKRLISYGLAR